MLRMVENVKVVGWGLNYFFQVGARRIKHGKSADDLELPEFVLEPEIITENDVGDGSAVVAVAAGAHMSLVLQENGQLRIWGQDFGNLYEKMTLLQVPGEATKIGMIACGKKHALALSVDGQVFSWGCGFFGRLGHGSEASYGKPKRIQYLWDACHNANTNGDNFDGTVFQVACGGAHSAAVTTNGIVYLWGFNRYHQCGRGNVSASSQEVRANMLLPRRLPLNMLDPNEYVSMVALGGQHSMILTQLGTVYSWGQASHGKLGHVAHYGIKMVSYPRKIEAFAGTDSSNSVFKLALGGEHSLALTCNGDVYSWGRNNFGQLGQGDMFDVKTPRQISFFLNKRVSDIQAGQSHSLAIATPRATGSIATSSDEIWTWGVGFGGGGSSPSVGFNRNCPDVWKTPRNVSLDWTESSQYHCTSASCGGAHTLVLLMENEMPPPLVSREEKRQQDQQQSDEADSHSSAADDEAEEEEEDDDMSVGQHIKMEHIFSACRHGRLNILRTILEQEPELVDTARDPSGNTLLICAAQNGLLPAVKLLVMNGANVNAQNRNGQTALHYAFTYNFLDVFDFLMGNGADDSILNIFGNNCYQGLREVK